MTELEHSIGTAIRARRAALNLSQRDLARMAGTTAAAISHIERGVRHPSAGLLARIAAAMECSADDLLRGAVQKGDNRHVAQVVAAMKGFPPEIQERVVEFCEYLKAGCNRRNRKGADSG